MPVHRTKALLIETTVQLIDVRGASSLQVDEVLNASGVSRGSLYHHFEDFYELIEVATAERFSASVDRSIVAIARILDTATSREECFAALRQITEQTQARELEAIRFERARALGMAGSNERFRRILGVQEQRVTDALADLFRRAQERGWMNSDFDPQAAAVLIQAYTLGRIVDDISPNQMDQEAWVTLISRLIERVFG